MNRSAAEQLISDLYVHALGRTPAIEEFERWVAALAGGGPPEEIVRAFYESAEFRNKTAVRSVFPMGHFHSPVVDPNTVANYLARERDTKFDEIAGITFDLQRMRAIWSEELSVIQSTPFTDSPSRLNRYDYLGGPFPPGDAITLRMMIFHYRPKRVIEIGSGYSTACILDSVEHAGLSEFHITCIEPDPARLQSLLRRGDSSKLTLHESLLQDIDCNIVDDLEENDILFIDSTHVLKTGSDVHFQLFHLLPRIRPGVVVQIHDILYPFEYHDEWIFDLNYSWNESYALRAFLMFNSEYKIIFWNSLYAREFGPLILDEFPTFMRNPGGSIWLQRI